METSTLYCEEKDLETCKKELLKNIEDDIKPEIPEDTNVALTEINQIFAQVLLKKGSKYEVRLYFHEQYVDFPPMSQIVPSIVNKAIKKMKQGLQTRYIEQQEFDTKDEADLYMKTRKEELKKDVKQFFKRFKDQRIRERFIPLDKFDQLKPGDYIRVWLINNAVLGELAHHDGIYIGNGKVIHVSNHDGSSSGAYLNKEKACARIGIFKDHFIRSDTKEISVLVFPIQFRRRTHIVIDAILSAMGRFCKGEYNLLFNNCQTFATYCATGKYKGHDTIILLNATNAAGLMAEAVFGKVGEKWANKLKDKIFDLFITQTGPETSYPINAQWSTIEKMIELLESTESLESEDKKTEINDRMKRLIEEL